MDVADAVSIERGFEAAQAALGPINGVIANAGINQAGPATKLAAKELDAVLDVNVHGVLPRLPAYRSAPSTASTAENGFRSVGSKKTNVPISRTGPIRFARAKPNWPRPPTRHSPIQRWPTSS